MKSLIGFLLVAIGLIAGLYFGVVWAFIGGIVSIVQQLRAEHMDATLLAFGIARIVFSGAIGWASACFFIIPGYVILASKK